jgi:peroxiredoxin
LAGFAKLYSELQPLGAAVVAASVDPLDKAKEVAAELPFPVAYGVTRAQADAIGAWWEERRSIVQPSEFVLDAAGKVLSSTYSSGPIGRVDPADVVRFINFREKQAQKK